MTVKTVEEQLRIVEIVVYRHSSGECSVYDINGVQAIDYIMKVKNVSKEVALDFYFAFIRFLQRREDDRDRFWLMMWKDVFDALMTRVRIEEE